jgi:hypothetical protein
MTSSETAKHVRHFENERRSENIAVIGGPSVNLSTHASQVDVLT